MKITVQLKCSGALLLLLAAAIPLAGCNKSSAQSSTDSTAMKPVAVQVAAAEIHPMQNMVLAQGTLQPIQGGSATLSAPIAGKIRSILVRDGDHVLAGQTLVIMDYRTSQALAQGAQAALLTAQAQAKEAGLAAKAAGIDQNSSLQLAKMNLQAAQASRTEQISLAKTALQAAETNLNKVLAGARPQEIAQAEQAVVQAQAASSHAAETDQRQTFLYSKGIVSLQQKQDADTADTQAKAALASAQQQLSLLKAGARPQDVQTARLAVQQQKQALQQTIVQEGAKVAAAQAALALAKHNSLHVDAAKQQAVAMQQAVLQKEAELSAAQTTAQYSILKAPVSGVVTARQLNPGDMSDPATPILKVVAVNALEMAAMVPAQNGIQIKPGMKAEVSTPDLPGRMFIGTVQSVGQVDPATNLLTIHILLPNPAGVLKVGVFATARIVLNTAQNAVTIPRAAIITRKGKPVVFVVDAANTAHQVTVVTGLQNNRLVQIKQGVASGDKVICLGQYELDDGAQVTPQPYNAADAGSEAGE